MIILGQSVYNNKKLASFLTSPTTDANLIKRYRMPTYVVLNSAKSIRYQNRILFLDCYRHRKANIIFKNLSQTEIQENLFYNYCECCGRLVGNVPELRFSYDPMEAAYLGPGIPLFFAFFRAVLYTMLVYLLGFGLPTLSSNAQVHIFMKQGS